MMNTYSYEITVEVSDTLPPLPMVFTIAKKEEGGVCLRQHKVVEQLSEGVMWAMLVITRDIVSGADDDTWQERFPA